MRKNERESRSEKERIYVRENRGKFTELGVGGVRVGSLLLLSASVVGVVTAADADAVVVVADAVVVRVSAVEDRLEYGRNYSSAFIDVLVHGSVQSYRKKNKRLLSKAIFSLLLLKESFFAKVFLS